MSRHLWPTPTARGKRHTLCTSRFPLQFRCVMRGIFCLSSRQCDCLSSHGQLVCLVDSFRYNRLATLALAAFDRVRALLAPSRGPLVGPSGLEWQSKQGSGGPPSAEVVMMADLLYAGSLVGTLGMSVALSVSQRLRHVSRHSTLAV